MKTGCQCSGWLLRDQAAEQELSSEGRKEIEAEHRLPTTACSQDKGKSDMWTFETRKGLLFSRLMRLAQYEQQAGIKSVSIKQAKF